MRKIKQAGRLTALVFLCVFLSAAAAGCGKNTNENSQQTGTEQTGKTGTAGGEAGQGLEPSGVNGKGGTELRIKVFGIRIRSGEERRERKRRREEKRRRKRRGERSGPGPEGRTGQ